MSAGVRRTLCQIVQVAEGVTKTAAHVGLRPLYLQSGRGSLLPVFLKLAGAHSGKSAEPPPHCQGRASTCEAAGPFNYISPVLPRGTDAIGKDLQVQLPTI